MEGLGIKYVFGRPLKGWLRQHMGMMRGWQRRFFMLDSGRFSCLTREDDVVAIKTYVLKDCELKEFPKSADSSFELTEKVTGESVVFRAANEEERKEWIKALRFTIYGDTGGGVFGVPLEVLMNYESKEGRTVPYIVEACLNHLKLYGQDTEGIFRMPGRAGLVKELRGKFDLGYRPVIDSVDVHTVGSLLKSYLRDLPESLVLPSFYQKAMNFALRYSDAKSDDELQMKELAGLSKLLKELPSANYATLAYICQFLHDLAGRSEITKMDSHNLSLVFGPNLIRHMDDNPELMMVTTDLTQQLAYMLIHHCPSLFTPIQSQETPQPEAAGNSPVTRRKESQDNIPTADLLHLSAPFDSQTDTSTSAPYPAALSDLMGVDFSKQQDELSPDQSRSLASSTNPGVTDQFKGCSMGAPDKREGSTLSETSGGVGCVDTGAASVSGVGSKPVPPKRVKSRTLKRNQQPPPASSPSKPDASAEPTRLNTAHLNTGTTSAVTDTPQHLHEKDKGSVSVSDDNSWGTGLNTAVGITNNQTQEGQRMGAADCHSVKNKDKSEEVVINEESQFHAGDCSDDLAANAAVDECLTLGVDMVTLSSSRTLLEAQVSALKTELVNAKSQYDCQVSSLKSQLNSVRSSFEDKIANLEQQHVIQIKDLTTRLAMEHKARAEAVDQTVNLQAELYRYKLQYGELQNPK